MLNWPKLSETVSPLVDFFTCQRCGNRDEHNHPWRWLEHDHRDRPTTKVVFLCRACSDEIIERHPRLYRRLDHWEPLPGSMPVCCGCIHNKGATCTNPDALINGGKGIALRFPEPSVAFVDGLTNGEAWGRQAVMWKGPVACDAKEEQV